ALLSGVSSYYALDVVRFFNRDSNLEVFDQLVKLFERRAGRPEKGWPDFDGLLDGRLFPAHILTEGQLRKSLAPTRLTAIREAVAHPDAPPRDVSIRYMVPWSDRHVIAASSVDVVLSHSVLEHVVDLEATYDALHCWLRTGGYMSHQIDFASHGLSTKWNGYRAYPELLWKLILGRRPFLINREPVSTHVELTRRAGFRIARDMRRRRSDGLDRRQLSVRWHTISDDDLTCCGAFLQSKKV